MSKRADSMQVVEVESRVLIAAVYAASAAAREALDAFDPHIRSLAIRQLSVEVEIREVAASLLRARSVPSVQAAVTSNNGPYTIDEVADLCHVSRDAVRKWLGSGKLRRTKAGRRTLVTHGDLQQFLQDSTERGRRHPVPVAA